MPPYLSFQLQIIKNPRVSASRNRGKKSTIKISLPSPPLLRNIFVPQLRLRLNKISHHLDQLRLIQNHYLHPVRP